MAHGDISKLTRLRRRSTGMQRKCTEWICQDRTCSVGPAKRSVEMGPSLEPRILAGLDKSQFMAN